MEKLGFNRVSRRVKTNPLLINFSLGILSLGNLSNVLAFTTSSWGRVYSVSGTGFFGFGLWRICASGTQSYSVGSLCTDTTGWPQDWYGASQTFAIFGFIGLLAGLTFTLLYLCLKQCKGNTTLIFGTAVFLLATGTIYLIGIIIFGAKFDSIYGEFVSGFGSLASLSWSFGLAIFADACAILAGALLVLHARQTRSTSPNGKRKKTEYRGKDQSSGWNQKQSAPSGKADNSDPNSVKPDSSKSSDVTKISPESVNTTAAIPIQNDNPKGANSTTANSKQSPPVPGRKKSPAVKQQTQKTALTRTDNGVMKSA